MAGREENRERLKCVLAVMTNVAAKHALVRWRRELGARVPIEVCPTSNLATLELADLARHPTLGGWLASGYPVCLCTDDPGVFATSLSAEYLRVARAFGVPTVAPPPEMCTDNGAMVAWAALERIHLAALGVGEEEEEAALAAAAATYGGATIEVRPRWPVAALAADTDSGGG